MSEQLLFLRQGITSSATCVEFPLHIFPGPPADPEHQQEGERDVEDHLRHVGQGFGAFVRAKRSQGLEQGTRRTLALLGNP